jgi:hypothetical protein
VDDLDEEGMLAELGLDIKPVEVSAHTPLQERVIAGFEDITNFVRENGRPPKHGDERDIFERLYAVRLDRIRDSEEFRDLLRPMDEFGLLSAEYEEDRNELEPEDEDAMLAELGVVSENPDAITNLQHVRPYAEINAAEEVARRIICKEFLKFKPLFERVQNDLSQGIRTTRPFKDNYKKDPEIKVGEFFILGGQKCYVVSIGEEFKTDQDRPNAPVRVIFDNGTENNYLLRSFQRALYKDDAARRISEPEAGPLFGFVESSEGVESGTIYVVRSNSTDPQIAPYRDVLHKIGVTGGDVESRIAKAKVDATFLLADVEIVATYKLVNINRSRLENLLHRFFGAARLDIEIKDRFGNPVKPREWFLVPLEAINEVVKKLQDNTLLNYEYDRATATLKQKI